MMSTSTTSSAPGRNLGLPRVNLSTPQAALAALQSGRDAVGYQAQLPQWDQLRAVPGGITAGELSLHLSGNFTNRSDLEVQRKLIIQAGGGIDNFGAAIRAGGALMIEGQSLDNSQGQFQSTASAIVLDAAGNIALAGGSVKGGQGAALLAAGNIELGTVQKVSNVLTLSDKNGTQTRELAAGEAAPHIQYGQKLHREHSVTHEGVQIDAGAGPLRLMAQGDIQALGAQLKTEGAALLAGRNVSIEAAKDSRLEQNAEWRRTIAAKCTTAFTTQSGLRWLRRPG